MSMNANGHAEVEDGSPQLNAPVNPENWPAPFRPDDEDAALEKALKKLQMDGDAKRYIAGNEGALAAGDYCQCPSSADSAYCQCPPIADTMFCQCPDTPRAHADEYDEEEVDDDEYEDAESDKVAADLSAELKKMYRVR